MVVSAAKTAKASPAPAATSGPAVAPRRTAHAVRTPTIALQRRCECGAPAGFSRRCAPCDGFALSPAGGFAWPARSPAPLAGAAAALDVGRVGATPPVPLPLQRQTRVSMPSDPAELEAQDFGRRVIAMREPPATPQSAVKSTSAGAVQRRATQPTLVSQRLAENIAATRTTGTSLPQPVRAFMEPRFGADFSRVRVHAGPDAAALSTQLNAHAFTLGRDIYFNAGQFRPETREGRELIAHELTHTIQQGDIVQRGDAGAAVSERTDRRIHRSLWDDIKKGASGIVNALGDPLQFLADKANMIPGFRMLTIVLGSNPINGAKVDPTPANILMALIEFIPGGGLITQALQNSGVFDKVGNWIAEKVKALVQTASAIKSAVTEFIGSLQVADIADPVGVWNRAKRIFTEPIDRLFSFCKGVITDILKFIKDAILLPLAKLAEGTPAWDLLCAVLGKNPITGENVDGKPDVLIGGFMKLIGQEEIWQNMQKANAVSRAFAWFKGAVAAVKAFVTAIPDKFKQLLTSLTIEDVVLVVDAFKKVVSVFGGFVADFVKWGLEAAFDLLKIIFDVVSPGAFEYVMKTGQALKAILKDPGPFVKNLIAAGKQGFENFRTNFVEHLKGALIDWLLGAVEGVYLPKALTLGEFGKFALSVFGITWAQIRGLIVKALGPKGEAIMKGLEIAFDVVKALITGGLPAVWEIIKEKLTNLKDMVIDAIVGFVKSAIIEKAIPKLLGMLVPGAGFIPLIVSIYDTIKVFIEKLSTIAAVVKSYVDSIVEIAQGNVGNAAKRVEAGFKNMLSLAISFFAGFVGVGGIPSKVKEAVAKLRELVMHALETAVNWLINKAKALFASLFGGKDGKDQPVTGQPVTIKLPFAMKSHPHTLTATISSTSIEVDMASNSGVLYKKIEKLKTQIAARKELKSQERDGIVGYLTDKQKALDFNSVKDAYAKSFGQTYTVLQPTPEFVRQYSLRIVSDLIQFAEVFGFTDLLVSAFVPDPLPNERFIPEPVRSNIRARLYERGSNWNSERDRVFRDGVIAIDAEVATKIVANLVAGDRTAAEAAIKDMKDRGKVLDSAAKEDFKAGVSYVVPRASSYAVDHNPSLAEHWAKMGGNTSSDASRHDAVEGKTLALDLVTRRFNSQKSSRDLSGELQRFKVNAWVGPGFTSEIAKDVSGAPNSDKAVTIDSHSLTYEDGTPFVPVG
jgi:hypothetical protein